VVLVTSCFRYLASASEVHWRARAGAPALKLLPNMIFQPNPEKVILVDLMKLDTQGVEKTTHPLRYSHSAACPPPEEVERLGDGLAHLALLRLVLDARAKQRLRHCTSPHTPVMHCL
jgi:hypothetical protein